MTTTAEKAVLDWFRPLLDAIRADERAAIRVAVTGMLRWKADELSLVSDPDGAWLSRADVLRVVES